MSEGGGKCWCVQIRSGSWWGVGGWILEGPGLSPRAVLGSNLVSPQASQVIFSQCPPLLP